MRVSCAEKDRLVVPKTVTAPDLRIEVFSQVDLDRKSGIPKPVGQVGAIEPAVVRFAVRTFPRFRCRDGRILEGRLIRP